MFFFSSRRRHTISLCDWSSDVCSSDLFSMGMLRDITAASSPSARNHLAPGLTPTSRNSSARGTPLHSLRSEERRVGKECRSRSVPYQEKNSGRVIHTIPEENARSEVKD